MVPNRIESLVEETNFGSRPAHVNLPAHGDLKSGKVMGVRKQVGLYMVIGIILITT